MFSMIFAIAANSIVPVTYLTDQTRIVTANDLKPAACSSINFTSIFYCPMGGGACNATDDSELVIGSPAIDDIQSGNVNYCFLGGGGNDSIRGEQNTDVCIGGSGTDSFHPSCETQMQ
jgi:Ca2+-binding RTX toxin-like protein